MIHTETDKSHLIRLVRNSGRAVRTIFDCGALHALDGIELAQLLGASELHTFECNPSSVDVCRRNHAEHLPATIRGYICEQAVSDREGEIEFHPIDITKTVTAHKDGNPGASSMFLANGSYTREHYVQTTINVPTITLDTYCRSHSAPDLLWLDLQGAELLALQGARSILPSVGFIHIEVGFRAMYKNQSMFWDIDQFLRQEGFKLAHLDVGRWPRIPSIYSMLRFGPWLGNAIYTYDKV
jgi:FkbM family methyltransferase